MSNERACEIVQFLDCTATGRILGYQSVPTQTLHAVSMVMGIIFPPKRLVLNTIAYESRPLKDQSHETVYRRDLRVQAMSAVDEAATASGLHVVACGQVHNGVRGAAKMAAGPRRLVGSLEDVSSVAWRAFL
jgi:hypothetical protein